MLICVVSLCPGLCHGCTFCRRGLLRPPLGRQCAPYWKHSATMKGRILPLFAAFLPHARCSPLFNVPSVTHLVLGFLCWKLKPKCAGLQCAMVLHSKLLFFVIFFRPKLLCRNPCHSSRPGGENWWMHYMSLYLWRRHLEDWTASYVH